ncbi:hypothetical protein BDZ97DRAFT_1862279, partial [Flammula alnicola]
MQAPTIGAAWGWMGVLALVAFSRMRREPLHTWWCLSLRESLASLGSTSGESAWFCHKRGSGGGVSFAFDSHGNGSATSRSDTVERDVIFPCLYLPTTFRGPPGLIPNTILRQPIL